MVQTTRPGGGWHAYFVRTPGTPLGVAAEALPDGARLEVMADREAPLPPALRPPFAWLRWNGPALGEVAPPPVPQCVAEMLQRRTEMRQVADTASERTPPATMVMIPCRAAPVHRGGETMSL